MTFDQLEFEVKNAWPNPTIEQSVKPWLNDVVSELAAQFELPALRLRTPATLAVTTANWLYNISAATHTSSYTYMKRVFRVSSAAVQHGFYLEEDLTQIDSIDPTHVETGTEVQRVVLESGTVGIFPKANDTLNIWYYRRPVAMVNGSDEVDGIPPEFGYSVLVPAVILRAMRIFPSIDSEVLGDNFKSLQWWTARYNAGLYGNGTAIGLIPYLSKQNRPYGVRVRGPRLGSALGGRW